MSRQRKKIIEDPNGVVFVKTITKDGLIHRRPIDPGKDYSKEDKDVRDVCKRLHTNKRIKEYRDKLKESYLD